MSVRLKRAAKALRKRYDVSYGPFTITAKEIAKERWCLRHLYGAKLCFDRAVFNVKGVDVCKRHMREV